MIHLDDFDGITGYRWSAWIAADGDLHYGGKAPRAAEKKVRLVGKVIAQTPIDLRAADLMFEKGMVLIRRGGFGMLLIFCEQRINVSMVDIVLDQGLAAMPPPPEPGTAPEAETRADQEQPAPANDTTTEDNLTPITTADLDAAPVPRNIIESLLDIYAEFLGPLARKLAYHDTREANLDLKKLPIGDWSTAMDILAARFDSMPKRTRFLERAGELKRELDY